MKNVIALVLAGGRVGQYGVLTRNRAKGALTVAGHYRIVDFALSCLRRAHIDRIGLIIQYLPASLIEHVGVGIPWDLNGYGRVLKIMPPFVGIEKTEWYKGTADALYQNMNFVDDFDPDEIVVMSGEHVVNLDFADVLNTHRDQKAEITFVVKEMPRHLCSQRFGYVTVNDAGRIESFAEKPDTPPSTLVSTGIYVFNAPVLRALLEQHAASPDQNLAKHILEDRAASMRCYAYQMPGEWEYMETVADFFELQMRFLQPESFERLQRMGVVTNLEFRGVGFAPAAKIAAGATVAGAMISPNCRIGGTVERSILSPGVVVMEGAEVRDSIIMHDCVVEAGAVVNRTIADRDVVFGAGSRVGSAGEGSPRPEDLVLVGKAARIGAGAVLEPGTQVQPRAEVRA